MQYALQGRSLAFRSDIEGLRGVAVGGVTLYHAQFPGFSGGFVGVDVFFVISGFLITSLLLRELEATGKVNLLQFWLRRARRLLPNALLVLVSVLLASFWLSPASEHADIARQVAAALLYFSNFDSAARAVNYFAADSSASPVLHFWSLSVEEQFYVAWPVLLLLMTAPFFRRLARKPAIILLGLIWLISLAYCALVAADNQPLAFFDTRSRAWQLATGGLLATLPAQFLTRVGSRRLAALAWAGLALIGFSCVALSDALAYPCWWALLPTIGAALVIAGGSATPKAPVVLLGATAAQWLGARSYSLYLWHWPILVLGKQLGGFDVPAVLLVLVALAISAVAYARVENPIRHGEGLLVSPRAFFSAVSAGAACVLLGCVAIALHPIAALSETGQFSRQIKEARTNLGVNVRDGCHLEFGQSQHGSCAYGDRRASRSAVLFGDSHAAQWFTALDRAATSTGWQVHAWTKSSCPAADITIWSRDRKTIDSSCDEWREDVLRKLIGPERPGLVFIATKTDYSGRMIDRASRKILEGAVARQAWAHGFDAMLRRLTDAGVKVVVIRDTPWMYRGYAKCLEWTANPKLCARSRADALAADPVEIKIAQRYASKLRIIDLSDAICDADECPLIRSNLIVYRDHHHLSEAFVRTLAVHYEPIFASYAAR